MLYCSAFNGSCRIGHPTANIPVVERYLVSLRVIYLQIIAPHVDVAADGFSLLRRNNPTLWNGLEKAHAGKHSSRIGLTWWPDGDAFGLQLSNSEMSCGDQKNKFRGRTVMFYRRLSGGAFVVGGSKQTVCYRLCVDCVNYIGRCLAITIMSMCWINEPENMAAICYIIN